MDITKQVKLNLQNPGNPAIVHAKQGDKDSRILEITLYDGTTAYEIPAGATVQIEGTKPDKTSFMYGGTIADGVVSVTLKPQVLTVAGIVPADIVLYSGTQRLSSFRINIVVQEKSFDDEATPSEDYIEPFSELVDELMRVKGAPLVANTAASMTDTERIYVYTGSETGYVAGNWYYYDGSSWQSGGVYNSQGIGTAYQQEVAQMVKQSAVASEPDSTPYLYRPTPNPSAILADEEIVGGTIAWNQLIPAANFSATGGTISTDANYVATFTASASGQQAYRSAGLLKDHVIIAAITYKTTTASTDVKMRVFTRDINGIASTDWQTIYAMNKQIVTGTASIGVVDRRASGWDPINVKNAMYIDLSAMFGSTIADYLYTLENGTAGAGVAKLREWGFLSKPYYAYNAGSLVSVNTEGKRVTGKNLFDESTIIHGSYSISDVDTITTGEKYRTVKMFLLAGTYTFSITLNNCVLLREWRDGTNYFISSSTNKHTFTTTTDGIYALCFRNSTTTEITEDFNTQIERGSAVTSYAPYKTTTYPTTDTDLNGIFYLDENNQLRTKGDVYHANGTITRIYHADVIDGGANLTVASVPQHSSGYYYCAIGISSAYTAANNTNLFNDGGYSAASGVVPGHIYEASGGSMIVVVLFDQTITTAAAANTYFASHPLHIVYELASAKQTTETADPYPETQIVGKGGTERWIDNRSVPVPVGNRTTYYIGVPDTPAANGTYRLTATVASGKTSMGWSS